MLRQISNLLNLIIHFVHFFLNKATGCAIHTALVLRHSPDGALLNSSRSGNQFVAFSRLTNGGSVPSDWILFSNGRDDLRVVRLSALTLISSVSACLRVLSLAQRALSFAGHSHYGAAVTRRRQITRQRRHYHYHSGFAGPLRRSPTSRKHAKSLAGSQRFNSKLA